MSESNIDPAKFKDCCWAWWHNPTSKTSMRLTLRGFTALTELGMKHSNMKVDSSLGKNLKIYMLLDRHMTAPFYIVRRDRIAFFGDTDRIMLELMGGDLDQYLKNFES